MVLVLDTEVSENGFNVGSDTQVVVERDCLKIASNVSHFCSSCRISGCEITALVTIVGLVKLKKNPLF